ncbi:hypothetical protein JXR93_13185 [bacterium]|nr:hypothetical protein [bacterium]
MKKIVFLFLIVTISLFASNNDVWDNDFYFKNLPTQTDANGKTTFTSTADKMFERLMLEYGVLSSSSFNDTAETLGSKGFELSTVYSFYSVGGKAIDGKNPWEGTYGGADPGLVHLINVKVRKGLPASLELGGNFTYIFGTHMFVTGVQLKMALLEGINILPDVSIRTSYNKLLGAREVNLDTLTFDFMIGYDFGVAGMIAIAPYFAWSMTKINATSELIAVNTSSNPFLSGDYSDETNYNNIVDSFSEYKGTVHRFVLGTRVHNAAFIFTPEVIFTTESMWGLNIKLGVDF